MKTKIQRRYDITVYPYEEDDEDTSSYHLEIKHIADRLVAMHIIAPRQFNTYTYLANLNNTVLFTDPDACRGTLIPQPCNDIDNIYEYLEDIDDYDEEQCAILSSAINVVWNDIFLSERNVLNENLKPCEE